MRSGDHANLIRVYNLQEYKKIKYSQVIALTRLGFITYSSLRKQWMNKGKKGKIVTTSLYWKIFSMSLLRYVVMSMSRGLSRNCLQGWQRCQVPWSCICGSIQGRIFCIGQDTWCCGLFLAWPVLYWEIALFWRTSRYWYRRLQKTEVGKLRTAL